MTRRGIRAANRVEKSRSDDERDLLMLHLLENEGLSTRLAGERLGVTKNVVIGMRRRIMLDYAASCVGDDAPDRHDGSMPPLWWRKADG